MVLLVWVALVASVIAAVMLASPPAQAATYTVTSTADSGAGSLRQAILDANDTAGVDTIGFATSLSGQTIKLASDLPTITDAAGLTIEGGSADITVDGFLGASGFRSRVFEVNSDAKVILNEITVEGSFIPNNGGTLTVRNSTIYNSANSTEVGDSGINDDRLTGGVGADSFSGGPGKDVATDFDASEGDTKDSTIP